jgi:hypothetical protein
MKKETGMALWQGHAGGRNRRVWTYWIGAVLAATAKACAGTTGGFALFCQIVPCSSVANARLPVEVDSGAAVA